MQYSIVNLSEVKNTSKDFVVTKDITYTYTNEKID